MEQKGGGGGSVHLESKRRNENRPNKSVVPLEEGAVDRTCDLWVLGRGSLVFSDNA